MRIAEIHIKITDSGQTVEYGLKNRTSAALALMEIIRIFEELVPLYEQYEQSASPYMDWYREYTRNQLSLLRAIDNEDADMIQYEILLIALNALCWIRAELDRQTNIDIETRIEAIARISTENIIFLKP